MTHIRIVYVLFVISFIFTLTNCSKDENPLEPENQSWDYGDSRSYNISTSEVITITDELTGYNFIFPEGGNGVLEIKSITKGPPLTYPATRFEVNYNGQEAILLDIAKATEEEVLLLGYGVIDNTVLDNSDIYENWWGIPSIYDDEVSVMFTLKGVLEFGKSPKISFKADPNKFAIYRFSSGTPAARWVAVENSVWECIQLWLSNMSSADRLAASQLISGDLSYQVTASKNGNSYVGGDNWYYSNAVFNLVPEVALETIAHEVGHYMHHVICGWDEYKAHIDRFPTDFWGYPVAHDIGSYREGRKEIFEDYAGFSEFIVTGEIGSYDPSNTANVNTIFHAFDSKSPSTEDFPSHEGFAVWMFGAMMRSNLQNSIYTFNPALGKVNVPVVDASIQEMIEIIRKGPDNVNELRQFMTDYLIGKGLPVETLSAMFEPIGWSYNGTGYVKDGNGNPIAGAQIISVCKVGSKPFYTQKSSPSAADGKFKLDRIFPGNNFLRVYYNGGSDSVDNSKEIKWENYTHNTVDLGTLNVNASTSTKYKSLSMSFVGNHEFINNSQPNTFGDYPPVPTSLDISSTAFYGNLQWSGNNFSLSHSNPNTNTTLTVDGEISSDGKMIVSLNYYYTLNDPADYLGRKEIEEEYHINNLPIGSVGSSSTSFQSTGPSVGSNITVTRWYHYQEAASMLNWTTNFEYVKTNFDASTSLIINMKN